MSIYEDMKTRRSKARQKNNKDQVPTQQQAIELLEAIAEKQVIPLIHKRFKQQLRHNPDADIELTDLSLPDAIPLLEEDYWFSFDVGRMMRRVLSEKLSWPEEKVYVTCRGRTINQMLPVAIFTIKLEFSD